VGLDGSGIAHRRELWRQQGQVLRPERGHQLLPGGKGDEEIGDRINKIIGRLADPATA
jgi:hypothetical protein